jgi:hypothetical protein
VRVVVRNLAWAVASCALFISCAGSGADHPAKSASPDTATVVLRMLLGSGGTAGARDFATLTVNATEPFVQTCVKSKGFEYSQLQPSSFMPLQPGAKLAPADYVKQFGFGISTTTPPAADTQDPNLSYLRSLSSDAQSRYSSAIADCRQSADDKLNGILLVSADLQSRVDAVKAAVTADPSVQAALATYHECMNVKGYDVASPADARKSVVDRLRAIPENGSKLELQQFELAIAGADHVCGADYQSAYQKAEEAAEASFLRQYRSLLPADLAVSG